MAVHCLKLAVSATVLNSYENQMDEASSSRSQSEEPDTTGPRWGDKILKLNIGGSSYRLRETTVKNRLADSRLGKFVSADIERRIRLCDAYFTASDEFYFERSAKMFEIVFKFYTTGQLHIPKDICHKEFKHELHYWKIPSSYISSCCRDDIDHLANGSLEKVLDDEDKQDDDQPRNMRERIHMFCEGDGTRASTVFSFASIFFVIASVLGLVIGSIHDFQVPIVKAALKKNITTGNYTNDPTVIWEPHPVFGYLETVCIVWFTFEYLLRFTVTPKRCQFVLQLMNIVDLIAIVPFYLELILALCGIDVASLSDIKGALLVVRVLRVLRVVRILKLGRYSAGMRTFALTLKSSARQLGMMAMVLTTGVVFFSTLLYFVEKDEHDTPFTSIPASFWWAIVTMTTVGYGDYVPVTIAGKLIASGAIISGVLVLALPITIIVDNFMKVSGSTNKSFFDRKKSEGSPRH